MSFSSSPLHLVWGSLLIGMLYPLVIGWIFPATIRNPGGGTFAAGVAVGLLYAHQMLPKESIPVLMLATMAAGLTAVGGHYAALALYSKILGQTSSWKGPSENEMAFRMVVICPFVIAAMVLCTVPLTLIMAQKDLGLSMQAEDLAPYTVVTPTATYHQARILERTHPAAHQSGFAWTILTQDGQELELPGEVHAQPEAHPTNPEYLAALKVAADSAALHKWEFHTLLSILPVGMVLFWLGIACMLIRDLHRYVNGLQDRSRSSAV